MNLAGQSLSLRQLGICGPAPRRGLSFCAETGLSHHTQLSGADHIQKAGGISPECAMLWVKPHRRDSRMSSRSNSALTLTDTEQDNKSDQENGKSTCVSFSNVTLHPYIGQNSPIVNVGDIKLQKWENTPEEVKAKSPWGIQEQGCNWLELTIGSQWLVEMTILMDLLVMFAA